MTLDAKRRLLLMNGVFLFLLGLLIGFLTDFGVLANNRMGLASHLEGILNYCHEKVPFGKVEAINGNIRAMLRRGRGYRDHEYLLLKVQKATATRRLRRTA